MKVIKKSEQWTILQKRSGRYAVRSAAGGYLHGDEKLTVLSTEGLAKKPEKKAEPAPQPAEVEATESEAEAPAE